MIFRKFLPFIVISFFLGTAITGKGFAESEAEDWFEDLFGIADNQVYAIDLITDFRPVEEFKWVRVTVDRGNVKLNEVHGDSKTLTGIRVAEYSLRENTTYRIGLALIRADGTTLEGGFRQWILELAESTTTTTIAIKRPDSPPAGDVPQEPQLIQGVRGQIFVGQFLNNVDSNTPPDSEEAPKLVTPTNTDGAPPPGDVLRTTVEKEGMGQNGSPIANQNSQEGSSQAISDGAPSCSIHLRKY